MKTLTLTKSTHTHLFNLIASLNKINASDNNHIQIKILKTTAIITANLFYGDIEYFIDLPHEHTPAEYISYIYEEYKPLVLAPTDTIIYPHQIYSTCNKIFTFNIKAKNITLHNNLRNFTLTLDPEEATIYNSQGQLTSYYYPKYRKNSAMHLHFYPKTNLKACNFTDFLKNDYLTIEILQKPLTIIKEYVTIIHSDTFKIYFKKITLKINR